MAIISYTKNFIFIKTPKTAGTSIQKSLMPICDPGLDIVSYGWVNTLTGQSCRPLQEFITLKDVPLLHESPFFTFGFTRNPYDQVLSRYFYQLKRKRLPAEYGRKKEDFNRWVSSIYVKNKEYTLDRTRHWLFDNKKPIVDHIGHFENIESDFCQICCKIGCGSLDLLHINKANYDNIKYRDWYSDSNRHLISYIFDFEIQYFKYKF